MPHLVKIMLILTVCLASRSGYRVDLTFVLDSSGSIQWFGDQNWELILNFTQRVVSRLTVTPDSSRIAGVLFSDNASVAFCLNSCDTTNCVNNKLKTLHNAGGSTNTQEALRLLRERVFTTDCGDRPDVPNIAILLTDGESDSSHELIIAEADRTRGTNITLIAIGISDRVNILEIRLIASLPHERNYYIVSDFDKLVDIEDRIVAAIHAIVEEINECLSKPCLNGGECLDDVGSYTCNCTGTGFEGEFCHIGTQTPGVGKEHIVVSIENASISINCGGRADHSYIWTVEGSPPRNGIIGQDSSTLIIQRITQTDFGTYTCLVKEHRADKWIPAAAYNLTNIAESSPATTQYFSSMEQAIQMKCPVCSKNLEVDCKWTRDGDTPIREDVVVGHDYSLAMIEVQKNDFGVYTCTATYAKHDTATWVSIELSEQKTGERRLGIAIGCSVSALVVIAILVVVVVWAIRSRRRKTGMDDDNAAAMPDSPSTETIKLARVVRRIYFNRIPRSSST